MERTKSQYNLPSRPDFITLQVQSVLHGTESISYLGSKIWSIVSEEFKHKRPLNSFKESIKMWVPTNCPCRLRKVCLAGVGFINSFERIPLFQANNINASNF